MANDKIYSVDDILDEYSVGKNKPEKDPAKTKSDRSRRNNSLADVLTDEYSLERILIESGFSGIPDKDDDIIDISLIQIQDEPNHPETPKIISNIVDYFETDKQNEEQKFENIKENIARAEKASEDPGVLDFSDDGETISQKAEKILENVRKMHKAENTIVSGHGSSSILNEDKTETFYNTEDTVSEPSTRNTGNTVNELFGNTKHTKNRSEADEDEAKLRKFSLSLNKPSFSKKFEEEQEAEKAALDAAYGKHDSIISERTSSDISDTISDDINDDAAWLNESPLSLKSVRRKAETPKNSSVSGKPSETENAKPAASVKPAEPEKLPMTEEEEDEARLKKFSLPLNKPSFSKIFGGNDSDKNKAEPVKFESEKAKPAASVKPAEPEKLPMTEEEEDEARLKKFSLPLNKPSFSKIFGGNDSDKNKAEPVKPASEKAKPAASVKPAEAEKTKSAASVKPAEAEKTIPAASDKPAETEKTKSAASVKPAEAEKTIPAASDKPAEAEKTKSAASVKPAEAEKTIPAASDKPAEAEKTKSAASVKPAETEKITMTEEEEDEARLKKFSLPLNKPSFSKILSGDKEEKDQDKTSDEKIRNSVTESIKTDRKKKPVSVERNDADQDDIISAVKKKAEVISSENGRQSHPDRPSVRSGPKHTEKAVRKPEFEKETIRTDETPSVRFKSYRSATRIQDAPNKIVKNPEDNIRYVSRNGDNGNYYPDEMRPQRKRKAESTPETKADIAPLSDLNDENIASSSGSHSVMSSLREVISSISDTLVPPRSRSVSSGKPLIEIKSTPETGFFSIDVDINENSSDAEQKSFIKNIDTSFSHSAKKHVDDYNSPEDASLIIDDLYDLKKNLSIKFLIELIAFIVSLYLTGSAVNGIHLPFSVDPVKFPQFFGIAMFIASVAVIVTSFSVITSGFRNIIKKKPDCDSLAAVNMTFSTLAAALSIISPSLISNKQIFIFTPVAIAAFMVNTLGKQLIVNRAVKNFKNLTASHDKHALFYIDDEAKAQQLTKGTVNDYPVLTVSRKTDFASDFLKYTYSSDISDKLCRKAIPFALIVSAVMTLIAMIIYSKTVKTFSLGYITSVYSLFLSAFAGFGIPLVVNIPLANAAENAKKSKAIILGYQSIDDFYDVNAVTVNASQLFPEHSIKLSAIKMFSDTKIDDAIIAAASIVHSSGSIFNGMFSRIIDNNTSLLEKVENYSYEESMGICGWIKNKRILFGTRQLMVNHNIEGMPPKSKEKDIVGKGNTAIYLSVSGNLAAMFILKMKADPDAAKCLDKLASNGISVIVKSIDPVITVTRISKLFDIPEDMIRIVPEQYHKYCDKLMSPVQKSSSSVICSGSLSSLTNALSETKSIHSSAVTGLVLQSTAAITALLLSAVFMFLGILGQINPLTLVTYHTIWLLITTLIMKIKPR